MILTNELAQKYIDFHSNDFFNHFLEDFYSISNLRNEKSKYLETEISKVEDILENREFGIYGRFIYFKNKAPIRTMFVRSKYFEGSQYRNRKGENYKSEYSYQYDTYVVQKKTMPCIGTTLYKLFEGDLSELTDDYIKVPMDEKDFCNIYLSDFDVFLLSIFLDQLLDFKNTFEPAAPVVQSGTNATTAPVVIESKIMFKDYEKIYNVLQNYFDEGDRAALKSILQSGKDTETPLVFLSSGNRLADAFKNLFESQYITGCKKQDLEKWILLNFRYKQGNTAKGYTAKYLNDIISTNKDSCSSKSKIIFDF